MISCGKKVDHVAAKESYILLGGALSWLVPYLLFCSLISHVLLSAFFPPDFLLIKFWILYFVGFFFKIKACLLFFQMPVSVLHVGHKTNFA